jgi:hypothetical protein
LEYYKQAYNDKMIKPNEKQNKTKREGLSFERSVAKGKKLTKRNSNNKKMNLFSIAKSFFFAVLVCCTNAQEGSGQNIILLT